MDKLLEKQAYYNELIETLKATDISTEVEKRLANTRSKIEEQVKAEIANDIIKCGHYLEVIAMLIEEEENEAKSETNEINIDASDNIVDNSNIATNMEV